MVYVPLATLLKEYVPALLVMPFRTDPVESASSSAMFGKTPLDVPSVTVPVIVNVGRLTVRRADPVCDWYVAVTSTEPEATTETSPEALTVAMVVSDVFQVADDVTVCVLPSDRRAVAAH